MQLAHEEEKSNLFTSRTNDWWRLIRKGLSPAFSANNLRHASTSSGCMLRAQSFKPLDVTQHRLMLSKSPSFGPYPIQKVPAA